MIVPAMIWPDGSKVIDETSGHAILAIRGLASLVVYFEYKFPGQTPGRWPPPDLGGL